MQPDSENNNNQAQPPQNPQPLPPPPPELAQLGGQSGYPQPSAASRTSQGWLGGPPPDWLPEGKVQVQPGQPSPNLSQPVPPQTYAQAATPQEPATESPMPFIEPQLPNPGFKRRSSVSPLRVMIVFVLFLLVALAVAWFVPPSRTLVANTLGMRGSLRVSVVAEAEGSGTGLPLQNVTVAVNGASAKTDAKGVAVIRGVRYGTARITVSKEGYGSASRQAQLSISPFLNNANTPVAVAFGLAATGPEISFKAVDWLTNQPLTGGTFMVGDIAAEPDAQGVVRVRVPDIGDRVAVRADLGDQYINRNFQLALDSKATTQLFVPAGKYYFVGNRDGTRSVYRSNLDGSQVETVVQGTGKETAHTEIMVSPNARYGVLVSTRDGAVNERQQLLERVYVVDLETKKLTKVDEGVSVKFADWSGNIFNYIVTNPSANGTAADTLRSVDASTNRVYNFESANRIWSLAIAFDKVAYLVEDSNQPDKSPMLKVASLQGGNIQIAGERVPRSSIQQLAFGRLAFKSDADLAWHEYSMETGNERNISQPDLDLNVQASYASVLSPDGTKRLYAVGKEFTYTLFVEDVDSGAKKQIVPSSTFTRGVRWLNDSVVLISLVRQEKAGDYAVAVSVDDGAVKQLRLDNAAVTVDDNQEEE